MASILIDWGTKLGVKLGELALGEARYLVCFKCIAEEFEKEKNKLIKRKESIEEDVAEARNRAENVRYEVHDWLKEVDEYIKEDQKNESHGKEDTKKKTTISNRWCPKCLGLYLRGKELDGMKLEILELRKQNFEKVGRTAKVPGVEFYAPQNFIELKSRTLAYKQILESFEDNNNIYMVGLHGLGGTGKTTLAKKAGLELKGRKVFDEVVFTTVSKDPNITKIQEEIAGPLGFPLNEETETNRPKKLWLRLTKGEKILIILDDVWDKLDFDAIGIPHGGNDHGCKVLLTSRDVGVCNLIGCEKFITLKPLSDEDAQMLFESLSGISNKSPKDLKDKGKKIAKQCKGLPVAIATIASTLKGRPSKDWGAALTALKRVGDTDEFIEIYKRLKVSYDRLNNDDAKRLLFLCSLFPEDYEIPVEDFTRFGIGLGLFGDVHFYEATRARVDKARAKLIDCCLLLEGQEGFVKMHDLVRDATHWIAHNEKQFGILDIVPERNAIEMQNTNAIRYLYCRGKFLNDHLDWTKLEILILADLDEDSVDVQEAFYGKMKNLRVLALNNGDPWTRLNLTLPISFEPLKHIRTLHLSNFKLNNIAFVENLQYLEILELRDCFIAELPILITKLAKLRLLSITNCNFGENPYKVIGQLSNIQELYFKNIYNAKFGSTWDLNMEIVANLFGKERVSITLQRYHIEIRDGSKSYGWTFDHSISRALAIQYFNPDASHAPIMDLVRRAECLDLLQIQGGHKAIIPDIIKAIGGDMNELTSFTLSSCSKIEYLIDATDTCSLWMARTVFSKLVELFLYDMDALKTLCYSCPQEISFETLKDVYVRNCPALTSLFRPCTAQSLVVLEKLVIRKCKKLKYIITDEQSGEEKIAEGDRDPMFPKLKTLTIDDCDRLGFIFPSFCARDLPLLENIKISSCSELKCIFGQSQLDDQTLHTNGKEVILPSLERMELIKVPKFVNIFPKCCHPNAMSSLTRRLSLRDGYDAKQLSPHKQYSFPWACMCCLSHAFELKSRRSSTNKENPTISNIENLDSTVSLGLQTLDSVCVRSFDTAQCVLGQSLILRNIKEISLENCGEMISLFSLSIAAKMLLERLRIDKCHRLRHIITSVGNDHPRIVFPKLKDLFVRNCSGLEYIVGQNHKEDQNHYIGIDIELPALEILHLENLDKITNIWPKCCNAACPSLKEFYVDNCLGFTITTICESVVCFDTRQMDCTTTKTSNSKCLLPIDTAQYTLRQLTRLQIVQKMGLKNCGKMESLFTVSTASKMSLEELTIDAYDELNYIITDMGDNLDTSIFPKLKKLTIMNCSKLKYIIGPYHDEGSIHDTGVHINLHVLKDLTLQNLPNMLGMCPVNCYTMCPSLNMLSVDNCPEFAINCIRNFKVPLDAIQLDHTATEGLLRMSNSGCMPSSDNAQCLLGRQSLMLRNIKEMSLNNCGRITSLFSLSIAAEMLLEELTIEDCDELKHIIADIGDSHNYMSIFPKLKMVTLRDCSKLIYMVGRNNDEGPNDNSGIHIDLPTLKDLRLMNLPNMVGICPVNFCATHPNLNRLSIMSCPKFAIKSVSDFVMVRWDATQLDGTTTKGLGAIVKYLQTLEDLDLGNFEMEETFGVEGLPIKDGEQMSLSLRNMRLRYLPKLKYIWRGPNNFFTLQNLKELQIEGCEQLEVIFSASMLRRIPVLKKLIIRNCQKLEKIIEEEEENVVCPEVCFPELKAIVVEECNSLKHVLSISTPNQFPKLKFVMIVEAGELEQVFRAKSQGRSEIEEAKQVLLPKLKGVILIKLPKVTNVMELETVEYRAALNCNSNITLTSTIADLKLIRREGLGFRDPMNLCDFDLRLDLQNLLSQIIDSYDKDSKNQESAVENTTAEITIVQSGNSEIEAVAECKRPSSKEHEDAHLISESSLKDQQQAHEETQDAMGIPQDIKEKPMDERFNESSSKDRQQTTVKVKEQSLESSKSKEADQMKLESKEHNLEDCSKLKEKVDDHLVTTSAPSKAERAQSSSSMTPIQKVSSQEIEKSKEQIFEEGFESKEKESDHKATLSTPSKTERAQSSSSVTPQEQKDAKLVGEPSWKEKQQPHTEATITEETEDHIQQKYPQLDQEIVEESLSKKADLNRASSTSLEPQPSPSPQEKEKAVDEHFSKSSLKDQQESNVKVKKQSLKEPFKSKEVDHTSEKSKDLIHEGDDMVTSSVPSKAERAQLSSLITPLHKASSENPEKSKKLIIEGDHMVTPSAPLKTEEAQSSSSPIHKASSQDDGVGDHVSMPPVSKIAEEHPTVEDNLVAKVFADLEVYLKMPLKDIATSKTNRIRLETSLNFLSRFFREDGALSHKLKSIIDSLQEELPGMLCSFNEASAIVNMFAELEDREKSIKEKLTEQTQAELTFPSKISQIHKLKDEAQQKETRLEFEKLKKEKSLMEENKRKEFEILKKEKSQMKEKKRKAQQELLKTEYEWSFLCCQFRDNQRVREVPTSTHLGSRNSMILHLNDATSSQGKIQVTQSETSTTEDTKHIPNLQGLEDSHVGTLIKNVEILEEEDIQVCMPAVSVVATEDNLVSKVLSDLKVSLNMPLDYIATSEDNTVRLYAALNFLSNLPFEDGAVSDELKAIINSLHQDFPSILTSFNDALVIIKEFAELEEKEKSIEEELARQKEASISFDFVCPKEEFMDEEKEKEAVLKEEISWLQVELESLKEKIKNYDASLSSFQEQKNTCAADIKILRKEFESIKKDKEQISDDQRKAQQKLLETNYKWGTLCSRFTMNCIASGSVF